MNKVILVGRLTKDPDLRTTNSGISCTRFTIAVNRKFKNDAGEYEADFISCVAWKGTAEFISRYFQKGQMIAIEGNLRTGSYQDKTHSDVTHFTTEVYVDQAEFTGSKSNDTDDGYRNTPQAAGRPQRAAESGNEVSYGAGSAELTYSNSGNDFEEILSDGDVPF